MKDLTEVASISGKGGLYRVLKPGRSGVVLESLDDKKVRMVINPTHKVSILAEISVYTNTEEGAVPLEEIFKKIHQEFGDDPGVDSRSTPEELMSFLEYILPEYDTARVYPSDVKKLVNWYVILLKETPELLKERTQDKIEETSSGSESENPRVEENQQDSSISGSEVGNKSTEKKPSDRKKK
jgi:hypothetical protein